MCVLSNVFCFDKALMLWSICNFTGTKYTYINYWLCLALFLARVKSHKSFFIQPLAAFLCYATLFSHALTACERGHHPTQRGPSVPLTWSIPMCRAASGSELSKWNFTAANKSPWHRAASARAWHSSDEGRPHCRGKRGVDTVSLVSQRETEGWKIRVHTHPFMQLVDLCDTSWIERTQFGQQDVVVGDHLQQVDWEVPEGKEWRF